MLRFLVVNPLQRLGGIAGALQDTADIKRCAQGHFLFYLYLLLTK